eukprot:scaffold3146_cov245-Pinguiococcus_pyrenoidosus.AAC.3
MRSPRAFVNTKEKQLGSGVSLAARKRQLGGVHRRKAIQSGTHERDVAHAPRLSVADGQLDLVREGLAHVAAGPSPDQVVAPGRAFALAPVDDHDVRHRRGGIHLKVRRVDEHWRAAASVQVRVRAVGALPDHVVSSRLHLLDFRREHDGHADDVSHHLLGCAGQVARPLSELRQLRPLVDASIVPPSARCGALIRAARSFTPVRRGSILLHVAAVLFAFHVLLVVDVILAEGVVLFALFVLFVLFRDQAVLVEIVGIPEVVAEHALPLHVREEGGIGGQLLPRGWLLLEEEEEARRSDEAAGVEVGGAAFYGALQELVGGQAALDVGGQLPPVRSRRAVHHGQVVQRCRRVPVRHNGHVFDISTPSLGCQEDAGGNEWLRWLSGSSARPVPCERAGRSHDRKVLHYAAVAATPSLLRELCALPLHHFDALRFSTALDARLPPEAARKSLGARCVCLTRTPHFPIFRLGASSRRPRLYLALGGYDTKRDEK